MHTEFFFFCIYHPMVIYVMHVCMYNVAYLMALDHVSVLFLICYIKFVSYENRGNSSSTININSCKYLFWLK